MTAQRLTCSTAEWLAMALLTLLVWAPLRPWLRHTPAMHKGECVIKCIACRVLRTRKDLRRALLGGAS